MSFERTGYDGSAPWDFTTRGKSRSRSPSEDDQHYLILIKKIHEQRIKSYQSAASVFKQGGHQPKDMRSLLQQRLDNDPFSGQNGHFRSAARSGGTVAIQNSPTLYEALNGLNDVVDFVVFKSELAARSMKLNPIKILGRVGMVTGVLGLAFSIYEARMNPTWENITLASLGGGFFVIGVLAGATILAPVWATIAAWGFFVLFTYQVGKVVYVAIQEMK